ncbi:MAG TPA: hypothetical protein VKB80_08925, partial [Kofleriaceae bacterium]|nr:hypothetical protein [Kofleriaceae bacterium]
APMPDAAAPDAGGGEPDAGRPACVWGELSPALFAMVNGPDYEESATLTGDGLAVFFTRFPLDGNGTADIYDAARESPDQPFSAPRLVGELSSDEDELSLEISGDGSEIFFQRFSDDILTASRPSGAAPFGEVAPTGLLGWSPTLSGDGLSLYFIDLDFERVARATRTAIGEPWDSPVDVGAVDGFDSIDVSADELTMLYSRGADGVSQPVAIARRDSTRDPFGAPVSAGDVFRLADDISSFVEASWDAGQHQIAVSVELMSSETGSDLWMSTCE